jgi:hypothetical protein
MAFTLQLVVSPFTKSSAHTEVCQENVGLLKLISNELLPPPSANSESSIFVAGLGDGVEEQRQQARQVDVPGASGGSRHGKLCFTKRVCSSS